MIRFKRCAIKFTHPDLGQTEIKESVGNVSHKLRSAVLKAHEVFWAEYNDPKWNTRKRKAKS